MLALLLLQTAPLDLTCFGGGTANKATVQTTYGQGNIYGNVGGTPYSGSASGSATQYGQRQQGFEDQVDVRLFGGDDRIRMPRTMLPAIRGGADGWFKITKLQASDRAITGKVAVNFINSPNVHIDRMTGVIRISGKAGDFVGQCRATSPEDKPKF